MIPNPKIEGVDPNDLFEYEGDKGFFYIGLIGAMPERTLGFYYRDDQYEFCFYAEQEWDGRRVYDVVVRDASMFRFTGPSPKIDRRDYDVIASNMTRFFSERFFFVPKKPIPSTEKFRNLRFSWKLR